MYLIGQLWFYLLCAALLGVLIGLTSRKLYRAVNLQHTLEAVEFRHTEQMAGVSADHEAALASLDQLRLEFKRVQEQGGSTHDLQTRIDLREQQLKDLGNQLRRVNQELMRNQVTQQQLAQERKQAATEIDTLKVQVASSRARLAQAVSQHEEEKAALLRQLVALMPAAGLPVAEPTRAAASPAAPAGLGTFNAAAALVGASLATAVTAARPAVTSTAAAAATVCAATAAPALAARHDGDDESHAGFPDSANPAADADAGAAFAGGAVEAGMPLPPAQLPPVAPTESTPELASVLHVAAQPASGMHEAIGTPHAEPTHGHRHGQGHGNDHGQALAHDADLGLHGAVQAGIAAAMASMTQPGAATQH